MWQSVWPVVSALFIAQGMQIPAPHGYVNDFAEVLPAELEAQLTRISDAVRARSGGEIVVVTLRDIGQNSESDVALQIGRQWGVGARGEPGDRARNAGVIILVVPKETNSSGDGVCRIDVGRGAEGFITDARSGAMCRDAIEFFRKRDYAGGVQQLASRVALAFANEFQFSLDSALVAAPAAPQRRASGRGFPPQFFFFLAFIILMVLRNRGGRGRRGRRGRRGNWPIFIPMGGGRGGFGGGFGGSGGGGFGGFGGGGGFSGGGGGGKW